jgi:hypothetical protein
MSVVTSHEHCQRTIRISVATGGKQSRLSESFSQVGFPLALFFQYRSKGFLVALGHCLG